METTAFPPAHALIQFLMGIDYKKHLNNLITITLTIAAVVYVLSQKVSEWWQNGGKDATIQLIKKVWNFLTVSYAWVRSEGYPKLKKLVNNVIETYTAWQSLVTV